MKKGIFIAFLLLVTCNAFSDSLPWDSDVRIPHERINHPSTLYIRNTAQAIGYFFIRAFQIIISPQDGPNCRFIPTCSEYGRRAVMRYGLLVGGFLIGDRLIRCNPYTIPQRDPLPDSLTK